MSNPLNLQVNYKYGNSGRSNADGFLDMNTNKQVKLINNFKGGNVNSVLVPQFLESNPNPIVAENQIYNSTQGFLNAEQTKNITRFGGRKSRKSKKSRKSRKSRKSKKSKKSKKTKKSKKSRKLRK